MFKRRRFDRYGDVGKPVSGAYLGSMDDRSDAIHPATGKPLSQAAQRALAEAETRRKALDARVAAMPREVDGRDGPEPTRYKDWEVKGLASDF